MKLFKKLAAVALAAVLVLTMAGCGGSSSVLMKDELLKVAMDRQKSMVGGTATHSKELDALAEKLVQEADKVVTQEENEIENVGDVKKILIGDKVVKAAGINTGANGYILKVVPNIQFKSSGAFTEVTQLQWMMLAVDPSNDAGKIGTTTLGENVDIGTAAGRIGGKEYIVILYTNHAA